MKTPIKWDGIVSVAVLACVITGAFYCVRHMPSPSYVITNPVPHARVETPEVPPPTPPPSTKQDCLEAQGIGDDKTQIVTFTIHNRCQFTMSDTHLNFKLYDKEDYRVGWLSEDIAPLEQNETVKFTLPYPIKDFPQATQISRAVLYWGKR